MEITLLILGFIVVFTALLSIPFWLYRLTNNENKKGPNNWISVFGRCYKRTKQDHHYLSGRLLGPTLIAVGLVIFSRGYSQADELAGSLTLLALGLFYTLRDGTIKMLCEDKKFRKLMLVSILLQFLLTIGYLFSYFGGALVYFFVIVISLYQGILIIVSSELRFEKENCSDDK